jgi:hypothetical protein
VELPYSDHDSARHGMESFPAILLIRWALGKRFEIGLNLAQ